MDQPRLVSDAEMLELIERCCARHDIALSTFGRLAIGDACLVNNLRGGNRSLTLKTARRVLAFIADRDAERDATRIATASPGKVGEVSGVPA